MQYVPLIAAPGYRRAPLPSVAAGSVKKAVCMAKGYAPFVRKIEVEVETLDMVKEAVEAGADIIMLDNMEPDIMAQARAPLPSVHLL